MFRRTWPERVTGIEPAFSAWEADVLPLNYTRKPAVKGSNRLAYCRHSSIAVADVGRVLRCDPL